LVQSALRRAEETHAETAIPKSTDTGTGRIGAALMRLDPEHAYTLLPRIDPGRVRSGSAVGLRDGAVLALVAVGLTAVEIAALRASAITMANRRAVVSVRRHGISWYIVLPDDLGGRLVAWISEAKIWGLPEPLFRGCRGPLTSMGIWKIFDRYRNPQGRQRCSLSRASKQPLNAARRRAA